MNIDLAFGEGEEVRVDDLTVEGQLFFFIYCLIILPNSIEFPIPNYKHHIFLYIFLMEW